MPKRNVHLLHPPETEHLAYLRDLLHADVHLTMGDEVPKDTNILVTGRPHREHLEDRPGLYALLIPFAGLPTTTTDLMKDFPQVNIHNLHHNAPMTAEMAITLLLAAAKQIVPIDRIFRSDDWTPRYTDNPTVVLDGKTVLILGYGAVGQRVGTVCEALGMRVLATRRKVTADMPDFVHPADTLPELLPQANVLMICLPGTPETNGTIGAAELELLPDNAILVNVGRGPVVDQEALYNALRDGNLHSAGLDVWYNYPTDVAAREHTPPADFPFNYFDNVVMSPHRAGGGGADEVEFRRMRGIAEVLNAAAKGEPIPHRVDLEAGY